MTHATSRRAVVGPIFHSLAFQLLAALTLVFLATMTRAQAPESFADLAERLSPAVVNVNTKANVARPLDDEANPLDDFFRRNFPDRPPQRPRRGDAVGSGFIISADGFIVTNNHVVENADEITVELFDGRGELPAKVIGTDPRTDIAVLKVEPREPLPFVPFGDSDVARVGDWVLAIGNPLGQGFSVSAGIISARNRELSGPYDDYLQTDAAINRGNSGGPLFSMRGEVIGVNTAILSTNGGSIGLGFSMSSNVVSRVVEQLREFGETRRGWLGVGIQNVTPDMAEAFSLDGAAGAAITEVHDGGPAEEAGLVAGDVILNFDGKAVSDTRALVRMVGEAEVGKSVRVVVFRDGSTQTLKVVLGRRESDEPAVRLPGAPEEPQETEVLGVKLSGVTTELQEQFGLPDTARGVIVVDVDQTSEAFEKGLRPGDLITEIGQQVVTSPQDVLDRLDAAREAGRKSVLLLVRRGGQPRFIAIAPN